VGVVGYGNARRSRSRTEPVQACHSGHNKLAANGQVCCLLEITMCQWYHELPYGAESSNPFR
jgi:hypothetical protein